MGSSNSQAVSEQEPLMPDAEKLAALVEFSAAAGHEINNPLAVILGRVSLLLKQEDNPARRQSLETIAGQALRVRDMIGDVMLYADPPPPEKVVIESVRSLMTRVIDEQRNAAAFGEEYTPPKIDFLDGEDCSIDADPDQFQTAIGEVVRNALHPSTQASRVEVSLDVFERDRDRCRILISDDGRGLTEHERAHLFDPFFSGRQAGRGLGFGLCKAYRFASLHDAILSVREIDSEGNEMTLQFCFEWPKS